MAFWGKQDDCTCITIPVDPLFYLSNLWLTAVIVAEWFHKWRFYGVETGAVSMTRPITGSDFQLMTCPVLLRKGQEWQLRKLLLMPVWKNAPAAYCKDVGSFSLKEKCWCFKIYLVLWRLLGHCIFFSYFSPTKKSGSALCHVTLTVLKSFFTTALVSLKCWDYVACR